MQEYQPKGEATSYRRRLPFIEYSHAKVRPAGGPAAPGDFVIASQESCNSVCQQPIVPLCVATKRVVAK